MDGVDVDTIGVESLDDRVRLIRQPKRGAAVARNVGIRAARADLIAFLDDDDRMLPGRLAAQFEAMNDHPEVGICHTQFRVIDANGRFAQAGHAVAVQYRDLLKGNVHVLMPTTMMRKSLLEEVGTFDSCLPTGQDIELIFRLARDCRLAFLPDTHLEYRRHVNNSSGSVRRDAENLTALLTKLRRFEEIAGQAADAGAASEGLAWASRYGATGAIIDVRAAWNRRDLVGLVANLFAASRLSLSVTVADLVGNRSLVGRLRRRRAKS